MGFRFRTPYTKIKRWMWTAVLLLAALFRLVSLADVPPGLAQDEVLNADIVSFIRQGENALFFREGYGHEPLYHYLSVPFQRILGDNFLSIRLPAVFLGLILVALTMRWAKQEFGEITAVIAGVGLATSWWPIIFSRIGIRPIFEPVFLLMAALAWTRRPWLAGLMLGLSMYTYTAARVLFLIPIIIALVQWLWPQQRSSRRQGVRHSMLILLVSLFIYLPLALTLQAEPTLQQRVTQLSGPLEALRQGDVGPVLETATATLKVFSFQGDPRWTYALPGRPLFDPITSLFFFSGFILAIWRFRQPTFQLLVIWLFVALIPSAVTPQAPSTIRLIGALPVVYIFPGLSLAFLSRSDWDRRVKSLIWFFFGIALTVNVGRTVIDGFSRWPGELETHLKYQTVLQEISRYITANPQGALVLTDGFYEPIDHDSLRRNLGFDAGERWVQVGQEVSGALVLPGEEDGRLVVPEFAAPPPILLDQAGIPEMPIFRNLGNPGFAVYNLPEMVMEPNIEPQLFDGRLSFLKVEVSPLVPDHPLELTTWWRVASGLPPDLAIFLHLIDADGRLVSQHDGFDAAPDRLKTGDWVIQRHLMPWPQNPDQPFSLEIGLYTRQDGRRLPVTTSIGTSDHIKLRSAWILTESN